MTRVRALVGAAALLVIGSCNDLSGPEQALTAAEAKWNDTGPSSYSFDVRRNCFCPSSVTRTVTATVSGGVFVSLVYTDSGTVADTTLFRELLTVPRLFDFVRTSLASQPAVANVTYDPTIGYPANAWFDFHAATADEEQGIEVLALRHP